MMTIGFLVSTVGASLLKIGLGNTWRFVEGSRRKRAVGRVGVVGRSSGPGNKFGPQCGGGFSHSSVS